MTYSGGRGGFQVGGAYIYADNPTARIAIMVKAGLNFYYTKHPTHRYIGLEPSLGFFETYLHATIDKELAMAELAAQENQNDAKVQQLQDRIKRDNEEIERQLNLRNISLYKKEQHEPYSQTNPYHFSKAPGQR